MFAGVETTIDPRPLFFRAPNLLDGHRMETSIVLIVAHISECRRFEVRQGGGLAAQPVQKTLPVAFSYLPPVETSGHVSCVEGFYH